MADVPKSPDVPKKSVQLSSPARLKLAEYEYSVHSVTVESGHTIHDVLQPEYLAHYAPKFKPYDEITVRTDDGSWYAKLLVLSVGRAWVKTFLLEDYKLVTTDVDQSQADRNDGAEVIWRGPILKHSVIRKGDRAVLKDGFGSKADAAAWMAENT